jgi:hypothetical protein
MHFSFYNAVFLIFHSASSTKFINNNGHYAHNTTSTPAQMEYHRVQFRNHHVSLHDIIIHQLFLHLRSL